MTRDEAIHKALKVLNCLNNDRVYETAWVKGAINACEEALEQPEEPRLVSYAPDGSSCTLNIDGEEVYFNREQPAQEPVAWMKSALDNARDVCKYLDHDMVKEAKAHTKFFWGDIDKIKEDEEALEQPSQEPVATVAVDNFGNISVGWIKNPNHNDKLYTHSHQWQGLTDDEIDAEALKDDGAAYFALGALWANKKLKEKNHG